MRKQRSRPLFLFLAVALAVLVPATIALSQGVVGERETRIITGIGGAPVEDKATDTTPFDFDGSDSRTDPLVGTKRPMDNVTFSQDNRKVRYLAWSTTATNLFPGDSNGKRDIVLMKRAGRFGGSLALGSADASGDQGNGESIKPSIDGQTYGKGAREVPPHCLTFQSTSTNLDSADRSNDWDVYLRMFNPRSIKSGKTILVSKGKTNARDAVVDGECKTISYEAGGNVYVYDVKGKDTISLGKGLHPDQQTDGKGVAYDKVGSNGRRQVFWQGITDPTKQDFQKIGRPKLASNTKSGGPGNGDSTDPSLNDNGDYVAFESTATNLCVDRCQGVSEDRNGAKKDVFRRTLTKDAPAGKGKGTQNEMQMISYDGTIDLQPDEDSDQVMLTGAGEQACFRSFGKNAREQKFRKDEQTGPFMHVYFWNFPRERRIGKFSGESKAGRTGEFTRKPGGSGIAAYNWSCAISNRGNFIAFSSDEEEESGEKNGTGIPDLFLRFMGGSDEGLGGDF